jgi:hypothetical protein
MGAEKQQQAPKLIHSGFFAPRTPMLPIQELTAWSAGLTGAKVWEAFLHSWRLRSHLAKSYRDACDSPKLDRRHELDFQWGSRNNRWPCFVLRNNSTRNTLSLMQHCYIAFGRSFCGAQWKIAFSAGNCRLLRVLIW